MITNFFTPLEFQVSVSRLPNVEFFVQRASIPSVSGNAVSVPTPFNPLHMTPDKLSYAPLDLTFIVDEKMSNYIEIFNWIKGTTFPERYAQFKNLSESDQGIFSDISLTALNSHKNPLIRFDFKNCIPVNLSDINMDTTLQDVVYPEVTATFVYTYFDIHPLGE